MSGPMYGQVADLYLEEFFKLKGVSKELINTELLRNQIQSIWKKSTIKSYIKEKGELQAFFSMGTTAKLDDDSKECHYILCAQKNPKYIPWLQKTFKKHQNNILKESVIEILVSDQKMATFFSKFGFTIESIGSYGYVDQALSLLKSEYPLADQIAQKHQIEVEPFIDPQDMPEMISLWKEVFGGQPEFFYCGGRASFLKKHKKFLEDKLDDYLSGKPSILYLFKKNGKILGYCDAGVYNNPWSAKNAGTQFCFSKELRGLKMGVYSYWLMLQDLQSIGVLTFSGNTSNPAVMALAKKMKRIPTTYSMLKGHGYFPNQYFFDFVNSLS